MQLQCCTKCTAIFGPAHSLQSVRIDTRSVTDTHQTQITSIYSLALCQESSIVFLLLTGKHAPHITQGTLKSERLVIILEILELGAPEGCEHCSTAAKQDDGGHKQRQWPRPCLVQNPAARDDTNNSRYCTARVGDPQQDGGILWR